jgi:hypothetical protein
MHFLPPDAPWVRSFIFRVPATIEPADFCSARSLSASPGFQSRVVDATSVLHTGILVSRSPAPNSLDATHQAIRRSGGRDAIQE